jgi:hypothetical protein
MKKEMFKVVKAIPILVGFLFFDLPNAYSGEYHTNQGQPDCLDIAGQNPKEVLDEIMAESTQNAQVQSCINII